MSKKGTSANKKAAYLAYKSNNTSAKNASKRLISHLKRHPNDQQSAEHRMPKWPEVKKHV